MKSFSELSLSPPLMRAITELGYETPSPIQAQALPLLLEKPTDFIGLAATGTGKTATFSIPMLEQIDPSVLAVQSLILCPTRELAMQVSGQINLLGKYKGIKALPIYGGSSYRHQIDGLKSGAQIVVGTPGRLVDLLEGGNLKLNRIKHVILDEADEMISMGFKEDLEKILGSTDREQSQIWLFSATMSKEIRKVADKYLKTPVHVQVNKTEVLPATITQLYYVTKESNKPEILCKMIDMADHFYGIIFCQTKSLVQDLTQYLIERGYKVDSLHGDKDQKSRERTMQSFRDHKVNILVCTDVASRGLDVKDISHVINYSIPKELDSYVHRIGRTARSGKEGYAMSLVTPSQQRMIWRLEEKTKSRMQEGVVPSRKQVGTKKISQILPKFQNESLAGKALELLDSSWKDALKGLSAEEIAARFLAMMNPNLFTENQGPKMPGPKQDNFEATRQFTSRRPDKDPKKSWGKDRDQQESRFKKSRPEKRAALFNDRDNDRRDDRRDRPAKKNKFHKKSGGKSYSQSERSW